MHDRRWIRITSLLAVVTLLGGAAVLFQPGQPHAADTAFEPDDQPPYIELTGVVRDFHERSHLAGHPDFENPPDLGFGRYSGNIGTQLGDDGDPVFVGGGWKIEKQYRDAGHRQICYTLYDPARGDIEGSRGQPSQGGITSADSFAQWYRDVPGVNMSMPLTLKLVRQSDGSYVFDDKNDPLYRSRGGFFPIDGKLFGNSEGRPEHNYHFTFELNTEFTYHADGNQFFKFTGDDDVWVFVDGRLVIDLGGVHAAHDQYLDLSRLGLEDGESYRLDFFFAERHRTQSNFRIHTNLKLKSRSLPPVTASYD